MITAVSLFIYFGIGMIFGLKHTKEMKDFLDEKPDSQQHYDMLSEFRSFENLIGLENVFRLIFIIFIIFWLPFYTYYYGGKIKDKIFK